MVRKFKALSVAIIGHGPSIVGKEYGALINLHDIVIRMGECDWQFKRQWDYGIKYSIGMVATGGSDDFLKLSRRKPKLSWWSYETSGTLLFDSDEVCLYKDIPMRLLRKTVWNWIGKGNKKFSRGTAACIAAFQLLSPTKITLFGFDDVARGFSLSEHPEELREFLKKNHKTTRRVATDHDWLRESNVIKEASEYYGVEVQFL